jgi:flagellar export protein FliJ
MSKFVFRLQAVLNTRHRELTCCQVEVERCHRDVTANLREQEEVRSRQLVLEEDFLAFSKSPSGPAEFLQFLSYRGHLEDEVERLRQAQVILEDCLRHAQEVAQEAARAHRRVEISKERALEAWSAEQQEKEIKLIDEWGSLRKSRGA